MTSSVRAYLMLRSANGEWSVSVFRTLEEVLDAWRNRPDPGSCTGVLHVGFDRPVSHSFEPLAKNSPARMLVTGAAKFALPRGFETSRKALGDVEGLPVHVGLRGWGYLQADDVVEAKPSVSEFLDLPQGWVKEFFRQHPDTSAALKSARIVDETSYLAREKDLEREVRFQSGLFRYRSLVQSNHFDPCVIVRSAPPWLLDRPFSTIEISVRISNVFTNIGVRRPRDLLAYDSESLLKLQNFGRRSLRDLYDALLSAMNEGPYDLEVKSAEMPQETLLDEFRQSLSGLDDRKKDILLSRMGLAGPVETLQQIGGRYSLTRERIRQLEMRAIEKVKKNAFWSNSLTTKLESLLLGREFPLPVIGLEAVDPWFAGVAKCSKAFEFVLANFCGGRASISHIKDIAYVGRLTDEEWVGIEREARRLLETGPEQGWSEPQCRTLVDSLLDESRREFRPLLWQSASTLCHFVEQPGGGRILAGYGRGADQLVEAVLRESEMPLHFSVIAERARERSGRDVDVRRAHNAAATIGILLGRGIYGLEHHLKLDNSMQNDLRDRLEETILDGPDDRQWHTSELLSNVVDSNVPYVQFLDKYNIDYVLRSSSAVRRLGRLTWAKASSSMGARIDVRQAIAAVIQQANEPLTANEIRQRLIAIRGVGDHFQISSTDLIVRLPEGRWGLNDRDLPLKRDQQSAYLDGIESILAERQTGLHITEIEDVTRGSLKGAPNMAPETIFSLAANDPRLKVTAGEFLFLAEWGEPRRETIMNAVAETMRTRGQFLTTAEIVREAESRTGRRCDEQAVLSCLRATEAIYDASTGRWSTPSNVDELNEDEMTASDFAEGEPSGFEGAVAP